MNRILNGVRQFVDLYIVAILATVVLASLLPARGDGAVFFDYATDVAIALLFFLYGARLSTEAVVEGVRHWRLHLVVFLSTFALFPLLGLASQLLVPGILTKQLALGVMFTCALPSTVQSSIAFTSIARGNVAAAIVSASFSNLIGIFITPVLVALMLTTDGGGFSPSAVLDIVVQLLLPFLAGQFARRWIGGWLAHNRKVLGLVDRGSILLVVYAAFSEGVVNGIWHQLSATDMVGLLAVNVVLLAIVLVTTSWGSRKLGFSREDRIAIVFCGSKKSLASGVPMASVLFPAQTVGLIVLPLMLFHQIQLMTCAVLARRYAASAPAPDAAPAASGQPAQAAA
ncbi:bile acid:sodium symporter [Longimycelium tulufanense]|uniref:Bile acid:sodium symporter n=1 Tax=Longimycelium tulufanense TaxID=907463 RepID=A0A8J3FTQ5_9PSEU|nr:bile acid:sodium symporter family protein [Longimycelium tulufanense]GGM36130.1 bile acid:sodium symporter [Longimycelium tulufanense]